MFKEERRGNFNEYGNPIDSESDQLFDDYGNPIKSEPIDFDDYGNPIKKQAFHDYGNLMNVKADADEYDPSVPTEADSPG